VEDITDWSVGKIRLQEGGGSLYDAAIDLLEPIAEIHERHASLKLGWKVQATVPGNELYQHIGPHQLWKSITHDYYAYVDTVVEVSDSDTIAVTGVHDATLRAGYKNKLTPLEFATTPFHEYYLGVVNCEYELIATGDWPAVLFDTGILTTESSLKLGWNTGRTFEELLEPGVLQAGQIWFAENSVTSGQINSYLSISNPAIFGVHEFDGADRLRPSAVIRAGVWGYTSEFKPTDQRCYFWKEEEPFILVSSGHSIESSLKYSWKGTPDPTQPSKDWIGWLVRDARPSYAGSYTFTVVRDVIIDYLDNSVAIYGKWADTIEEAKLLYQDITPASGVLSISKAQLRRGGLEFIEYMGANTDPIVNASRKLSWQTTRDPSAKPEGTYPKKHLLQWKRIPKTMRTRGTLFWIMDKVNSQPCMLMDLYKMYVIERLGMSIDEMTEKEGGNLWNNHWGPHGYQGLSARIADLRRAGWVGKTADGLIGLTAKGGVVYQKLMSEGKYEV
jgi:hypothetical protein